MAKKTIYELPSPEVNRTEIVEDCTGGKEYEVTEKRKKVIKVTCDCDKIFTLEDGKKVCIAYEEPEKVWRLGCGLASNKIEGDEIENKLNPIKASKRRNR